MNLFNNCTREYRSFIHDSRQPLQAMMLVTRILMNKKLDPELKSGIETLQQQVNYLKDLISEFEAVNARSEFDLYSIITTCLENVKALANQKRIVIDTTNLTPIPFTMIGNRTNIQRVIINLLSNAIKYNKPDGTISIVLSTLEDRVVIKFKDTGFGIPQEYHHKIFEIDFRIPEYIETGGTGLGLSICKQIIEQHNGQLTLEYSEYGVGSTFTVKLPIFS